MSFWEFYWSNFTNTFHAWWWVIVPAYLYGSMRNFFNYHLMRSFLKNTTWRIMEIKLPRLEEKSPKLMENVLDGFWTVSGELDHFLDFWVDGNVQDWISLEILGVEGKVHFCLWCRDFRFDNLMSHLYAQYPEAEIVELKKEDDYLRLIPEGIPSDEWDAWGMTWRLSKPDAYPIRTYPAFQDIVSGQIVDPLNDQMELIGNLGPGEYMFFQLLINPADDDDFYPEFKNILEKILARGKYQEPTSAWAEFKEHASLLPKNIIRGILGQELLTIEPAAESEESVPFLKLSPREQTSVKAMEENFSKRGYFCQYRTAYVFRKESLRNSNKGAMAGTVNQFNTVDLNGFSVYRPYFTSAYLFLKKSRLAYKKRRLVRLMKKRQFSGARYILNTEEIATLWHFPDIGNEVPAAPRVDYKKANAPRNLPIEQQ